MRKLFRYIESKYEDWFDYVPATYGRGSRYEAYVRFLGVLPVLVALFLLLTGIGIFLSNPYRFYGSIKKYLVHESIRLHTESNLNADSVRVDWHMQLSNPVTVYQNGTLRKVNFNRQGLNFFQVYYNNRPLACFEHFKGDDWSEYDYELRINQTADGTFLSSLTVNDGAKSIKKGDCY